MTDRKKLARKRLILLQLAEKSGNVSKVCRMHNISRSQFYEYKKSFRKFGLEGLIDKPRIPGPHPKELSDDIKKRIFDLSLEYPSFGQQKIADQLALEGISVCATTIRNVWIKAGMETRYKRLVKLGIFD